jgi:hypothetical protein
LGIYLAWKTSLPSAPDMKVDSVMRRGGGEGKERVNADRLSEAARIERTITLWKAS